MVKDILNQGNHIDGEVVSSVDVKEDKQSALIMEDVPEVQS
jgi:hypothetical protein